MDGKLLRLKITQAEMYDLGNIDNIDHHILYDSGSKVAVDITAEVKQAELLSAVRPYNVVSNTGVIEGLLDGTVKTVKDFHEAGGVPCITGFEYQELTGQDYTRLRQSMVALRDAQRTVEERTDDMRKYCLEAKLVHSQEK